MNNTRSFSQLSETLFVSPQIQLDDIESIKASGIKTVICHRPDHELSPIEPNFATLESALKEQGVSMIYQPIPQISMDDVELLNKTLAAQEQPILMYCTSGTRSALLWAIGEVSLNQKDRSETLQIAQSAGYELEPYL